VLVGDSTKQLRRDVRVLGTSATASKDRGAMANGKTDCPDGLCFDEIGYWSEIKLDIVRKYAHAYSQILSKKRFDYAYIDGFAGPGVHLAKSSNEFVLAVP
jgi:hypothetical protein